MIRAEISAEKDSERGNNFRTIILPAAPRIKALLVSADKERAEKMVSLLAAEQFQVRAFLPNELPANAAELAEQGLIMLLDVSAPELTEMQAGTLDDYVRHGGGLIAVGGETTFRAQSLAGTRLEAMLPLAAVLETVLPPPVMALVLVIDTSGSMRDGGRLEMAQRAARLVVDEVRHEDSLGILAFSSASQWVVPLEPIQDKAAVLAKIDALRTRRDRYRAGAGAARLALEEAAADRRHLILLTDGISVPGDFQELAGELAAGGITLSAVSIGGAADERLLAAMARTARGRYYHCSDSESVPQVLVEETRTAAAEVSPLRRPMVLHQLPRLPQAAGLNLTASVETVAKPGSELLLLADSGAPLLAWWRLGRGVVLSIAAHVNPGASESTGIEQAFWGRLAQFVQREATRKRWQAWLTTVQVTTTLHIDASTESGEFLNGTQVQLDLHSPDGTARHRPV